VLGLDLATWFLGGAVLSLIAASQGLCDRLRRRHPSVWEELGRPSMLRSSELEFRAVRQFLQKGRFQVLGDPVLTRWARTFLILIWVVVVALLAFAIRVGWPWGH
jgi:hypothetical protein